MDMGIPAGSKENDVSPAFVILLWQKKSLSPISNLEERD
jgi:hypothetical protein